MAVPVHARDVLNELKWSRGRLEDAVITYLHRGAPGDVMEVEGRDVREVAPGWLVLEGAQIPWHRVLRIELDGQVVWERRAAEP